MSEEKRARHLERLLGDRFRFGRCLGRGGMGEVWAAKDVEMDREVAIKILGAELSGDVEFVARFRAEVKMLAKFGHPRIVRIFEQGMLHEDQRVYMVMELLPGRTLRVLLEELRAQGEVLDAVSAAFFAVQMADALTAAHDAGITHRDVKPENMILNRAGHLTLFDFGLAKAAEGTGRQAREARSAGPRAAAAGAQAPDQTKRSLMLGTPRYMAPETITDGLVDPRVDLYAVGILLVMMLTGEYPYDIGAGDERSLLRAHVEQAPRLHRDKNPECPEGLWAIALKLLEKDPDRRFQSARALDDALSVFLRLSAPPGHASEAMVTERNERTRREAFERRGTPSRKPASASPPEALEAPEEPELPEEKEKEKVAPRVAPDRTAPLAPGFVAKTPCASGADRTVRMRADAKVPSPVYAPVIEEAPPRKLPSGVHDLRTLRSAAVPGSAPGTPAPATPGKPLEVAAPAPEKPRDVTGVPWVRRPARALFVMAGIALGTMGAWVCAMGVLMVKEAWERPADAKVSVTATASAAPSATAVASPAPSATAVVSAAPSVTAAPAAPVPRAPTPRPALQSTQSPPSKRPSIIF